MEKISANSDTRLRVKPQAQEANRVMARVKITAAPTMNASRQPSATSTSSNHQPGGEHQLGDQSHRLVVGGDAIVAGHGDVHAFGNEGSFKLFNPL